MPLHTVRSGPHGLSAAYTHVVHLEGLWMVGQAQWFLVHKHPYRAGVKECFESLDSHQAIKSSPLTLPPEMPLSSSLVADKSSSVA